MEAHTTARQQEPTGLLVAFVATAALVLGVVCRTAVVDTLRAGVPPILDAIVLPSRPDVVAAPPQPQASPSATATPPAAPATAVSARPVTVRTATARTATASLSGPPTIRLANAVPISNVVALPSTTANEPTRTLTGTGTVHSVSSTTSTTSGANRGGRGTHVHHQASHAPAQPHDAAHSEHGNGGRHPGR